MKDFLQIAWRTYKSWKADRCHPHGAALAFFALIAFAPFVILQTLIVLKFRGMEVVRDQFIPFLAHWLGPSLALLVRYLAENVEKFKLNATSLTLGTLCLTALGVGSFTEHIRATIRIIWGFPREEVSIKEFIQEKTWAFAMAFILVLWAFIGTSARIFFRESNHISFEADISTLAKIIEFVATTLFWTPMITFLYKMLIPVRVSLREILPGAFFTSLMIFGGRYLADRYLLSEHAANLTGYAGAMFTYLLLAYFYCEIFLIGGELTHVLALRYRKKHPHHLKIVA